MVYPKNGISGNKKEWSTDTCYTIDEPWKSCAKWNKPFTNNHCVSPFTLNIQNWQYIETESRWGVVYVGRCRGWGDSGIMAKEMVSFWMSENILKLIIMIDTQLWIYWKPFI